MAMQINGDAAREALGNRNALPKFSKKEFLETFMVLPQARFETKGDGLRVAIVHEGEGAPLEKGMRVKVNYTGWLETGKKFDSSVGRPEPFEFTLGAGQVIKGWEEGLAGIKPGERRQLVIPPELAYGDRRQGKIPPRATLIFNVEAVAVTAAPHNPNGNLSIRA